MCKHIPHGHVDRLYLNPMENPSLGPCFSVLSLACAARASVTADIMSASADEREMQR
jgi:hypothetical protein